MRLFAILLMNLVEFRYIWSEDQVNTV